MLRTYRLLALGLSCLLLFSACGDKRAPSDVSGTTSDTGSTPASSTPHTSSAPGSTASGTVQTTAPPPASTTAERVTYLKQTTLSGQVEKDGTVYVEYSISYPVLAGNPQAAALINQQLDAVAQQYIAYAKDTLFELAWMETHTLPYSLHVEGQAAYGGRDVFSIYFIELEFIGGTHPVQYFHSYVFNPLTGVMLTLANVLNVPDPVDYILSLIEAEIAAHPEKYYSDAVNLMRRLYPSLERYWFFESGGLAVFFDPYDIAPYSTGNPSFLIPYTTLGTYLMVDPSVV